MGWGWDDSRDAHQQVYDDSQNQNQDFDNKAKFSHELIGGAAAFEGMKLFEDRQRKEGKEVNHSFAKELIAGFAGAEVDRLAETKGMNEYDRVEARRHAERQGPELYDQHYQQQGGGGYSGGDQWDPQSQQPNFNYNNNY